ncbi:putative non-specific serine/threonine protein kinase [Helianthus annuus]|nr:putative non-specific serine/threonine protein kinase [Helianthus annuus]KAJ0583228.1 putative non-specific serine/threonine protein kinase [Helianthus annuus]KAJ0745965.1 putative non-specific serine/threonine protein kinase [Helianthus annuus]KAJ0748967.1 putative non-specific serine/threonine protein kinase [Helianthus annuus]KAJ0917356.1 putative non-specific serine/threonine protein kinase [Helianthus annuus]
MCSSFFLKAVLLLATLIQMNVAGSGSNLGTDHIALLKIKSKITDDPHGVFRSWNDSLPFCMWPGVTCGRRHQRVTSLNLTGKGMEGSLSPFVGNLSFLRSIILDDNRFYGSIPHEVSRLSRLQKLSLRKNFFTGEIPANISSCSKLRFFSLYSNNFTGGIPPSIGNLTYLERLSLGRNILGGSIPDSFSQLKELRQLGLAGNGLVGVFPLSSYNLSMLETLNIPENQFYGNLPTDLCLRQPHLWLLEIGVNNFSGLLPPSISNCSELEILGASTNDFKGGIKIDFGKLQKLRNLVLGPNNFESNPVDFKNLFDSLSNCSNLEALELIQSQLLGVLPNSLGNFSSKLNYLGLLANYVSGSRQIGWPD